MLQSSSTDAAKWSSIAFVVCLAVFCPSQHYEDDDADVGADLVPMMTMTDVTGSLAVEGQMLFALELPTVEHQASYTWHIMGFVRSFVTGVSMWSLGLTRSPQNMNHVLRNQEFEPSSDEAAEQMWIMDNFEATLSSWGCGLLCFALICTSSDDTCSGSHARCHWISSSTSKLQAPAVESSDHPDVINLVLFICCYS